MLATLIKQRITNVPQKTTMLSASAKPTGATGMVGTNHMLLRRLKQKAQAVRVNKASRRTAEKDGSPSMKCAAPQPPDEMADTDVERRLTDAGRRTPELLAEAASSHGCRTGEAKITKGYRLKAKYIIHTVALHLPGFPKAKKNFCFPDNLILTARYQ